MASRFTSILIANRGEIACRIIRAARADGYRTVAVFSDADAGALHVREADSAMRIGPAAPAQSYLAAQNIIDAAKASAAEAVHPGYGFLAENADFAERCLAAGLAFIGPPPAAMRAMGDKSAAKARMLAAGIPCLPGYHGEDQADSRLTAEAARIGFPVMVKASAGGGGRGMRMAHAPRELAAALRAARAEATSAFGDGRLLLERALTDARHVEVQVFGDEHGAIVHLGERDCSIQRRHQKVIEEAPSPAVSTALRERMGAAAVAAARAVGYVGAGTVEFLLAADGAFYFLEMNTRIQVEHPVTECVTGIDLVRLQFAVAQGAPLGFGQPDVALRGHAIEARLYAEDPFAGFMPRAGRILAWRPGSGEGVRVDHGLCEGTDVSPFYDPLLAKIIAFGRDREQARRRLLRALNETLLAGVGDNRAFLVAALQRRDFIEGGATTAFIAESSMGPASPPPAALALAALVFAQSGGAGSPSPPWRQTPLLIESGGVKSALAVRRRGDEWIVCGEHENIALRLIERGDHEIRVLRDGAVVRALFARTGDALTLNLDGVGYDFVDRTYAPPQRADDNADGRVRAPVSGVLVSVDVAAGEAVRRGQALATIEAMKMQHEILAPIDGIVESVHTAAGAQAPARALLFEIRTASAIESGSSRT
ncbi:MAG: biotin carboxylase N-terminal domain-containing protein [Roseiarcus sp.]